MRSPQAFEIAGFSASNRNCSSAVGIIQGASNLRPDVRRHFQRGLVAEDPEDLPTVPWLREPLQGGLEYWRQSTVCRTAIRNEGVVSWFSILARLGLLRSRCGIRSGLGQLSFREQ